MNRLYGIPLFPVVLAALGLPIFGKASAAKTGVKKTLANVDSAVLYTKLFLLFATAILTVVFAVWLVQKLRKKTCFCSICGGISEKR